MRLTHLSLVHFRTYHSLELDFPPGSVLLHGMNAQGKTSLLEAIYYLATAHSPHTSSDRQLINWLALRSEPRPFAKMSAEVVTRDEIRKLVVRLILEPGLPGQEPRFKKEIYVNGVRRHSADLRAALNAVLFLPQDMALVEGSPGERRHYLDDVLCQVDSVYCHALTEYGKVVTQRNALLKQLQERGDAADASGQLDFWDAQITEYGATLISARAIALAELELHAGPIHRELTAGADSLRLDYRPSFDPLAPPEYQLELGLNVPVARAGLDRDEIRERLSARLAQGRDEDIARGQTLVGPHRDDFRFLAGPVDLGVYGSRGQGRTAVLALKLAETSWLRDRVGEWPVLLLDEVLAELDQTRRVDLLNRINGAEQIVMTTTDLGLFADDFRRKAAVWEVSEGTITNSQ
ncbi:MAG: DNA replication/repair protein RecF [Chloroflexi bacterium]|nr:DNA replication/repair protein RecF [Chloroflexota bacterium]MBI3760933.1 DNA replication/repair protein RecF [Chloroflexota bacterium]